MELSQPVIAYFAIGNYRVGSSLVYTLFFFFFSRCPLVLFAALLLNGLLCATPAEPAEIQPCEAVAAAAAVACQLNICHSWVPLVLVFGWLLSAPWQPGRQGCVTV